MSWPARTSSQRCTVSIEKPDDGLEQVVRREAAAAIKAGQLDVVIDNRDVQKAKQLINDEFDIPSEVDDFWKVFRSEVLPAVRKNQQVVVEARLSEPPELRARIAADAKAQLVKAGAAEAETKVTVLSAYKQGYSWLYDVVRPALAGKPIDSIVIRFAEIGHPRRGRSRRCSRRRGGCSSSSQSTRFWRAS